MGRHHLWGGVHNSGQNALPGEKRKKLPKISGRNFPHTFCKKLQIERVPVSTSVNLLLFRDSPRFGRPRLRWWTWRGGQIRPSRTMSLAEKAGLNCCKGWTKPFQRRQSSSCGTNSRWAKSRPQRKWVYNTPNKMISPIAHATHLTNPRWLRWNASPFSVPTSPMKTAGWKRAKLRVVNFPFGPLPLHHW